MRTVKRRRMTDRQWRNPTKRERQVKEKKRKREEINQTQDQSYVWLIEGVKTLKKKENRRFCTTKLLRSSEHSSLPPLCDGVVYLRRALK